MEKISTITGVAVPLRRSNVDTDQIIPAVYLKRVTKTGYDDGLFSAWRQDPEFVLNQAAYANPRVLIACGVDPEVYSGFAFGMGIDRSFMFRHSLEDLRPLFEGDVRFSSAFGTEI